MRNIAVALLFLSCFLPLACLAKEQSAVATVKANINIDTNNGHSLIEGCSGFNVRIADKIWSYSHPDFRRAVFELNPGWLRYFSGTMGSAFNSATGLYDHDYTLMHDHQEQYNIGYKYTQAKGPHRVSDLYNLLGEIGGKLVVTVNAFTETPDIVAEFARFCKNNNIIVEVWQFCNEPYFYLPHRERFWWNDGYDYAAKMKPYADSIKSVFPDAKLSLNYTWDGIWGFMKEINKYQEENGAYWDVFSKHSYAPHVGQYEPFDKGYTRLNTKIIEATDKQAMSQIEKWTWPDIPLLITEFGVWNKPLNGIMSAIYNAEYTLRQLQHPNAFLIGSHEISNKYLPANNFRNKIENAYSKSLPLNTDSLSDGIIIDDEGKSLRMVHRATGNSSYTYNTDLKGGVKVPGLNNTMVEGQYARAFKGNNGSDYLIVTNRSDKWIEYSVLINNMPLNTNAEIEYLWSEKAQAQNIEIQHKKENLSALKVPPHSVVLASWENTHRSISETRIFNTSLTNNGVQLKWWKKANAKSYTIHYGLNPKQLKQSIELTNKESNSFVIENLTRGRDYYFAVQVIGEKHKTEFSNIVQVKFDKPGQPKIFRTARRDTTITVYWHSVANAEKYLIKVNGNNGFSRVFDAANVFAYRIEGLEYNVDYNITVTALNGLGESIPSNNVTLMCKKGLPIPPRNISATQMPNNHVLIKWINQDSINLDIRFRILRGEKLHHFTEIASELSGDTYIDETAEPAKIYYYTIRSYTKAGSDNYHPNIATLILNDKSVKIEITSISKIDNNYTVKVDFDNIALDGQVDYGISLSDVSFLTVEETVYKATRINNKSFEVDIPINNIEKNGTYAVKAFVNTNGQSVYSNPPFKTISVNKQNK